MNKLILDQILKNCKDKPLITEEEILKGFQNHRAFYEKINDGLEILKWETPGDITLSIQYILFQDHIGKSLFVSGDLGSACYQFGKDDTFKSINQLSVYQFNQTCKASEVGRDFYDWNYNCKKQLVEYFIEIFDNEIEKREFELHSKEYIEFEERFWDNTDTSIDNSWGSALYLDILGSIQSEFEWNKWLQEYCEQFWGQDWWEKDLVPGREIHPRCQYHYYGIVEAVKHLE